MKQLIPVLALSFIFAASCKNDSSKMINTDVMPPVTKKNPKTLSIHNEDRVDNYYWMNDKENPEVIAYLNAENDYYRESTAHTEKFQNDLFEEMKSRIKEDDSSVPYKLNGYWYQVRYEKGKDYPIYTRRKGSMDAEEEIMFDVNKMAKGHAYFNLGGVSVSPDNTYASFGIDTVSRRKYTIQVKNLKTGEILPEKIETTTGGSTWANDNKTLFYTRKDEQTLRSSQIFKHILGEAPENDTLVFEEKDETFNTYVYKTKSKDFIIIGSSSTMSDEYQILNADQPDGEFRLFSERRRGLEYDIAHYNDHFYILTNKDEAQNFKLMKTSLEATSESHWEEMIAHRENVLLEGIDIFNKFLVTSERSNGLTRIHVQSWDESEDYYLPFTSETYTARTTTNVDFDTKLLRYSYNSLTNPASVIEFDMVDKTETVLKEQEVQDPNFDKNNYISERIWATASDGTEIPVSLVYKKGIKRNGKNPLLQYGYGSYGATMDPYFSTTRLSLLDRGFIYAIAHVRGGEYLGREWYESGKLLRKKNTFTDFVDVSKHLIDQKYTSPEHLYAMGGSAGGLLMGAVINMAPELYNGVIAAVPFVDVVTTMLDETIPLTTGEYDEWGNPNDKEYYDYIKTYSPYDNVEAKAYPNLLVTTGLYDSQVQYWEPAKWVAKLREMKTDTNKLYLETNMDAGHGGASGRFEALKELAKDYAFILDLEQITE
ncbi:S9 family peptidase [Psychroflexus sediminis]|uniref:Proline-specific endopeptidase n=1 Tax=Psychroflexus sediminis TaxID=470826 RepID=A0A1G7XFQ5_9FLAO|nr:S9 family peptidase [Psychroflexus sediminis]SDG82943.1 oligopeptidase B [Psychroflexus sediminis]